jgi:hypothetical protein
MKTTPLFMLLGAAAGVGAVAWRLLHIGQALTVSVPVHGFVVWGFAAAGLLAGLLLGLLVDRMLAPRGVTARKAGVQDYLVGLAAVALCPATAVTGTYLVPDQVSAPLAERISKQQSLLKALAQPLAARSYTYAAAVAELRRLDQVGEGYARALLGPGTEQAYVPQLLRWGMGPHHDKVEEELQKRGALPAEPQVTPWAFEAETDEQDRELNERIDRIRARGKQLLASAVSGKPRAIGLTVRWATAYAAQGEALKVTRVYKRSGEVQKLWDLASGLAEAARELDRLASKDWEEESAVLKKMAGQLRAATGRKWAGAEAVILSALGTVRGEAAADDLANALSLIEVKVPLYAQVAKYPLAAGQASWWLAKGGLKEVFGGLRGKLAGHELRNQRDNRKLARAAAAIERLEAALSAALQRDTVPPGAGKPAAPSRPGWATPAVATWDPEEVTQTVFAVLRLARYQGAELTLEDGQKVDFVAVIRKHWDQDFRVLKLVVPATHTREQAVEHATRVAAHFVKLYAAQLAKQWREAAAKVTAARPQLNEARGQKYPDDVREPIKAPFKTSLWGAKMDLLKKLLEPTGFDARHLDVDGGAVAGRFNAAVEEVRDMVEKGFVAELDRLASPDAPITGPSVKKGGCWFAIFMAGDKPGRPVVNPFELAEQIMDGVPLNIPADAKLPNGDIDVTKCPGSRVGAVKELAGAEFRERLRLGPKVARPAAAGGAVAGEGQGVGTPPPDGER